MTIHFKMLETLREAIMRDLRRPHPHAGERVGFVSARFGNSLHGLIVLAHSFHPVSDEHYDVDHEVGARFNSAAVRAALQVALSDDVGMFHVHVHTHRGIPWPSDMDWSEWKKFVPDFWHVRPNLPHGALILSEDRINGWCWYPRTNHPIRIHRFTLVGGGMQSWRSST
jgi:hypothetical protein